MVNRLFVLIITLLLMLTSCGIANSTSSIRKADFQRDRTLERIVSEFGGGDLIQTDEFGNKSLKKDAAEKVDPVEKRRAAYFFYKADAYLTKAYEFRSKSLYDQSEYLAKQSLEYLNLSEAVLNEKEPAPAIAPVKAEPKPVSAPAPVKAEPKPVPAPAPVKAEPKPVPAPAPVKEEPKPVPAPAPVKEEPKPVPAPAPVKEEPKPAPVAEPVKEEKPSLKGDPFADKKAEDKKVEEKPKEEKKPSYYDVYEEMRQKYLKKQEEQKAKEKESGKEKKDEKKEDKKEEDKVKKDEKAPEGGAK